MTIYSYIDLYLDLLVRPYICHNDDKSTMTTSPSAGCEPNVFYTRNDIHLEIQIDLDRGHLRNGIDHSTS